ncbi:MAG: lysostaphin resistance A-like protein [Pseudanabaenaceae cyanobacterium]
MQNLITASEAWIQKLTTVLTCSLAIAIISLSLWGSASHPQPQTRFDLLQTDLLLQSAPAPLWSYLPFPTEDLYQQALDSYTRILPQLPAQDMDKLRLNLGILQAKMGKTQDAIATWQGIQLRNSQIWLVGQILSGLWANPPQILPTAERQLSDTLSGWYLQEALHQLYRVQYRDDRLQALAQQQQQSAQTALMKLLWVNFVPIVGGLVGVLSWLILAMRWLWCKPTTLPQPRWSVDWTAWQAWGAISFWFISFLSISQLLLPWLIKIFHLARPSENDYFGKSLWVLIPYLLSVLPPLLWIIWRFRPRWLWSSPWSWRAIAWGIGGYITAIPVVLSFSILSQIILGGKGGGNPLLPILVDSPDPTAKWILWFTVGICAPICEELLFRGFLLPSLSSYLPLWGAICLSGVSFALVHLNLADLLPLSLLGCCLGYVYWRSQNLWAAILFHSLWNTGSFLALTALAS